MVGLILAATLDLFLSTLLNLDMLFSIRMFSWLSIVIFAIMLFVYKKYKINPILVIVIGAIIGILLQL